MSVDYRPDYDPADVDSDYGHTGGEITVPTFTGDTRPFRFWCQKALPLVYDDSLSYYEVLCKMADYLNNFMTDLTTVEDSMTEFGQQFVINQQFLNSMADQLGQNVADLEAYINARMDDFMAAYTQLQTYVNNYFDNLDVQEEINTKLDEMASDGTLNDLFDPVLETWMQQKTAQIDAAIAGQDAIQAAQNARISVLEGRMDTFSGLPSGSTSGNAELLDIRTNFLGETYPTAGDAVRASDMIASGFQSIGFSRLTEWDGNESDSQFDTIQIDVTSYKGGHMVVIANTYQFVNDIEQGAGIELFGTNVAGKTVDSNARQYPFPDGVSGIPSPVFKDFTVLTTSVQDEERILIQLAIPEDFQYQYLKLGNVAPIPGEGYSYTQPAAIVYANSWSKTQVDPTLTIAGAAADAKAAGDAINELNERIGDVKVFDKNLFSSYYPSTLTSGYYIKPGDGARSTASSWSFFSFFKVIPGSKIRISNYANAPSSVVGLAFYETASVYTYVSGVDYSVDTGLEVTVPATAKYMRISVHNNYVDKFAFSFEVEPWILDIENKATEAYDKTGIITLGKNLFDKSAITTGRYINGNGGLTYGSGFNVSDFIAVSEGVTYQISKAWNAWVYDSSKAARHIITPEVCYTTVSGDAFIRFTVKDADIDTAQVEASTYISKYLSYGYKVDKDDLNFDSVSSAPDNMFNPSVVKQGFLNATTGNVTSTSGDYYVTPFLAVEENKIYTVSGMWGTLCLYKSDGTLSRTVPTFTNKDNMGVATFKAGATDKFVRFTVQSANYGKCKFEENIGYSKHTGNVSGIVEAENVNGDIAKVTHVYVGQDCYFTTINDANNAISGNNKHNRFVIHILKGTYNETFRTKDYVDYIGDNKHQCIINYISDNESDYVNRSTIFAETNSKIAELTIRTTGSKYPIHADANYGLPYVVTIEDCIIKHDGYQDTSIAAGGTGIGIGLHFYQHVVVRRCIVAGTSNAFGVASIYCHNDDQNNTQERSLRNRSLTVEDCVLKDSYYGLRFDAIESVDGQDNDIIYIGNVNTCNTPFLSNPGTYNSWHVYSLNSTPNYEG